MPKHAIEVKWVFWALLSWVIIFASLVWCLFYIFLNSQYTLVGKSISCEQRPSFEYFMRCNARFDGPACTEESQTRMMDFYAPIDAACAQLEPDRPFVFPVHSEPEQIEIASTE